MIIFNDQYGMCVNRFLEKLFANTKLCKEFRYLMDILERMYATNLKLFIPYEKAKKETACKNRLVNYLSITVVDVKASGHREVVMLNRPSRSVRA